MTDERQALEPSALRRGDPPQLGDLVVVGRLAVTDSGFVYAARAGRDLAAVVLLNEGAESDSYGRARFLEAIEIAQGDPEHPVLGSETDPEVAPWVAVAVPSWEVGHRIGRELLAPVTLDDVPHATTAAGPAYRPHWYQRGAVGRWRLWPLPWPRSLTSAGRWTYLASFGLVLLIATLALLIAVKIFENQPPSPPPPGPVPPGPTPPSPSGPPTPSPSGPPTPTQGPPTSPGDTGESSVPPIV
jgi:hypothetical protein